MARLDIAELIQDSSPTAFMLVQTAKLCTGRARPGASRWGPAVLRTWIGGFAYSNLASVVLLAVGAGAKLQVI